MILFEMRHIIPAIHDPVQQFPYCEGFYMSREPVQCIAHNNHVEINHTIVGPGCMRTAEVCSGIFVEQKRGRTVKENLSAFVQMHLLCKTCSVQQCITTGQCRQVQNSSLLSLLLSSRTIAHIVTMVCLS